MVPGGPVARRGSPAKGWRRRPCCVCRRTFFYVAALLDDAELRNRCDGDVRVAVRRDDPVCYVCILHNGIRKESVRELPVLKATSRCNRCGGSGIVSKAPRISCRQCNGLGFLLASPPGSTRPVQRRPMWARYQGEARRAPRDGAQKDE